MDMKKISKIPSCGKDFDFTGKQVVVGAKQLKKAVANGRAKYVFLAENADPAVTEPLEAMCSEKDILIHWVFDTFSLPSIVTSFES